MTRSRVSPEFLKRSLAPGEALSRSPLLPTATGEPRGELFDVTVDIDKLEVELNKVLPELVSLIAKRKKVWITALGGDPEAEVPSAEPEPVYDAKARERIQGNIVPGFNKDRQHFLFFKFGTTQGAKRWVQWIAPLISSMDEVLAFRRAYRALRLRLGVPNPPLCSAWVSAARSRSYPATSSPHAT